MRHADRIKAKNNPVVLSNIKGKGKTFKLGVPSLEKVHIIGEGVDYIAGEQDKPKYKNFDGTYYLLPQGRYKITFEKSIKSGFECLQTNLEWTTCPQKCTEYPCRNANGAKYVMRDVFLNINTFECDCTFKHNGTPTFSFDSLSYRCLTNQEDEYKYRAFFKDSTYSMFKRHHEKYGPSKFYTCDLSKVTERTERIPYEP